MSDEKPEHPEPEERLVRPPGLMLMLLAASPFLIAAAVFLFLRWL